MRTNLVDRVSSLLLSLSLLIGVAVTALGLLFWLRFNSIQAEAPVDRGFGIRNGQKNAPEDTERTFDEPSLSELVQLDEPSTLATLNLVESIVDATSAIDGLEETVANGSTTSRPPGRDGVEGDDVIPRFDRWELKFTARDRPRRAACTSRSSLFYRKTEQRFPSYHDRQNRLRMPTKGEDRRI